MACVLCWPLPLSYFATLTLHVGFTNRRVSSFVSYQQCRHFFLTSLRIPRTICISFQFMIPASLGATLHIAFLLARALMYCVGCISYSSLTRSHLSGNRLASVVIISKMNLHSDSAHSKILCRNTSFRKPYFKMSDCFRIFAHSCSAFRDQSHLNDG